MGYFYSFPSNAFMVYDIQIYGDISGQPEVIVSVGSV
jgi:hypothetical protein